MRKAKVLACCLLILPLAVTPPPVPGNRTNPLHPTKAHPQLAKPFEGELRACGLLLAAGRFQQAAEGFQAVAAKAVSAGDLDVAVRATSNAGACQFNLHEYQSALESFLNARRMAFGRGDTSKAAALDANIASLYTELGEVESAAKWIEFSLQQIRGEERRRFLPKLEIQMAVLRAEQGRMSEAEQLFRDGIEAADRAGDIETYALGCNRMGEAFLLAGDLARAEPPLVEAFRIRKLHHLPLDTSYHRLGRLRLAQGDLTSASNLLDRAVELASRAQNLMPTWDIYYSRGLVRLTQERLSAALADFRIAEHLARDWQWSLPRAETARISVESKLDELWSASIETAGRLYLETGDRALAEEAFRAAEGNRPTYLPAAVPASVPPIWWEAIRELEHAEMAALSDTSPATRQRIERARANLALIEAANPRGGMGLLNPPEDLAKQVEAALPADTVLFSFHLRNRDSWLWVVNHNELELLRLPPLADVNRQLAAFSAAVQRNSGEGAAAGARLFATLFAGVPPRFRRHSRWLLSLDQNLFQIPVAALVEQPGAQPIYVAERHVIQVISGVLPWLDCATRQKAQWMSRNGSPALFLGIGDAIYNLADPRRRIENRTTARRASPLNLFAAGGEPGLTLPRLVASGPELAACTHAWRGDSMLLEGARATRALLLTELRRDPAVIHFATHFVASAEDSSHMVFEDSSMRREAGAGELIALALNPEGQTELLAASDVASWPVHAQLVSLSGCHSAAGAALPGVGLLGLTRAWLAAGARSVVGSLWDMPDESGALFSALYRNLNGRQTVDPARALNSAQREMIRAGGWFGQPRYWGAYFVVAND